MGHEHERDPDLPLDLLQLDLHLLAQLQVERAERLVEQQHLRPVHQRPGERDPLTLTAGELARLAATEVARGARWRAPRLDPAPALRLRDPLHLQPVLDVLRDRHVREQRVVLEDGVDVPVERRPVRHVDPVEQDRARSWAARSPRSCAASSSCPSPTGRAARRTRRPRCRGRRRRPRPPVRIAWSRLHRDRGGCATARAGHRSRRVSLIRVAAPAPRRLHPNVRRTRARGFTTRCRPATRSGGPPPSRGDRGSGRAGHARSPRPRRAPRCARAATTCR